ELGIRHGFWGSIAEGATFRGLGRTRTERGKAVIRRNAADLDASEARVNDIHFAWRAGTPTPVDDELDRALEQRRRLPEGGQMQLQWTLDSRSPRRRARAR